MHSQQPPGVVQNCSALQCSKRNTEQCGDDHAPVTRGRMRAQYPLPHGPVPVAGNAGTWWNGSMSPVKTHAFLALVAWGPFAWGGGGDFKYA